MNTEDFFTLIWGQGTGLIASIDKHGVWKHKKCATIGEAAALVGRLDAAGAPVYHSCGLYDGVPRTAANVKSVRCFWLDIDCGDGKGYTSQQEASANLGQFVSELGLPSPYIINSGAGLHVYWPLCKDIRSEQWLPIAKLLKEACKKFGLKADPSRTSDVASVLRPVGTTNNKHGKLVSVLVGGETCEIETFVKCLSKYTAVDDLGEMPSFIDARATDELSANMSTGDTAPAAPDLVLASCGALKKFSVSGGNCPEPQWYHSLGAVIYLEGGDTLAHEWSKGHPKYTHAETQKKIDQLKTLSGPTTCEKLAEYYDECATCPLRGQIKTPLQIGRTVPADVNEIDLAGDVFTPPPVPRGYRIAHRNGKYGVWKRAADPAEPDIPVFDSLLYVDRIIQEPDNSFLSVCERTDSGMTTTLVPTDSFADKAWMKPLLRKCIGVNDRNARHLKDYLQSYVVTNSFVPTVKTYDNLGWHADGLLVGDRMYRTNGKVDTVELSAKITEWTKGMGPAPNGKASRWSEIIDTVFNQPGLEHMQFMIMCSFASPLLHFTGDKGSILVYGHSPDGGYGKTTAERAALSVWGTWDKRSTSLQSTTDNAWLAMLSAMSHLPVIYDELTNYDDKRLSQFIHNISSGKPKARLDQHSTPRSMPNPWDLIVCASGNTLLSDKLSVAKSNASAELSRIFEYTFAPFKGVSSLQTHEATALMLELEQHVGTAGEVYAAAIAQNRLKLKNAMASTMQRLGQAHSFEGMDRYYARLLAAVVVSTKIANKLGLVSFDVGALENWIVDTIKLQQQNIKAVSTDPNSKFDELLQEMWPDILITAGDDNLLLNGRGMGVEIIQRPRTTVKGWQCVPQVSETHGPGARQYTVPKFYLFEAAVKHWCIRRGLDFKHMLTQWENEGRIEGGGLKRKRRWGVGLPEFRAASANVIEVKDPGAMSAVLPLTQGHVAAI